MINVFTDNTVNPVYTIIPIVIISARKFLLHQKHEAL